MAVAVLWLHYSGRPEARFVHEVDVVWLAKVIVGIVVLELLLPEGMDKVGFEVVWGVFYEGGFFVLPADFGIAFAEGVEAFFFGSLDNKGVDIDGPARLLVSGDECRFECRTS